jgi:hypothetical protein
MYKLATINQNICHVITNGVHGNLISRLWNAILIQFCHFLPLIIIVAVGHIVSIIIAFVKLLISQITIMNKIMQSHVSNNDILLSFK